MGVSKLLDGRVTTTDKFPANLFIFHAVGVVIKPKCLLSTGWEFFTGEDAICFRLQSASRACPSFAIESRRGNCKNNRTSR